MIVGMCVCKCISFVNKEQRILITFNLAILNEQLSIVELDMMINTFV